MPEFVENDCGFVVPYLDVDAMAEKAVSYARNRELFAGYGRHARQQVQARHTVDAAGPALMERIEAVCAARLAGQTVPELSELETLVANWM